MCKCTPEIRTPYCGVGNCVWPGSKPEGSRKETPSFFKADPSDPVEPTPLSLRDEHMKNKTAEGFVLMNHEGWIRHDSFRFTAFGCMQAATEHYGCDWESLQNSPGKWVIVPAKLQVTGNPVDLGE